LGGSCFELDELCSIEELTKVLDNKIEMHFGLNSMHMVRIDGEFKAIAARSEMPYRAIHVPLKNMLAETQRCFCFEDVRGSLICVYYPEYMDGINAPGWHFHFISDDRTKGGHVFDLIMKHGCVKMDKIDNIEIQIPTEPMFDTYDLKNASKNDIKSVEQGK